MKKLLFLILFFFFTSCATIPDLERKKTEGDFTAEFYNYGWAQVYDATKFVFRHSEDCLISWTYRSCNIDYAREEKRIWVIIPTGFSMDMGIYFEPQNESKTKVIFVKGAFTGAAWRGTKIERLIDEVRFYLGNGEAAYTKYTHEEYLKRREEKAK